MFRIILGSSLFLLFIAMVGLYVSTRLRPYRIRTEVAISASPERVWEVLTDFDAYPDWNPFIVNADGAPSAGERLRVELSTDGQAMVFEPIVLAAEPERELRWIGRFGVPGVPGVVDGEHYFLIEEMGDRRTRLVQGETFTGVLVPIVRRALDVKDGFTAMNSALKHRVETMHR
ncbi:SRPBCC domain-containing protein [Nocardiopsis gilva YIM 90087]|uniref:SRPBCC domain-containing protein n=1 Tax=Nocardiopsis gilva YIM 90087 TaxID=1235441 RepID=A0A223S2I8_9ACTN|nr:SRPBCC domain-containing protein [Nocardiopsis gilva]ASU82287.1 SRPBCC domain-containing protein [Nocardiopsis gilva YIM 90087]